MKRIAITLLGSLLTASLTAFKNIETSKKEIIASLQKNNPQALTQFNQFCCQYDKSVINFFDTKNNLPLASHIKQMEHDLVTLKDASHDKQFTTVRTLLVDLNEQLQALVMLLKKYTQSKNTVGLALKVRRFKKLLPPPINKWTEFSLFWSLHHRMRC